jgi:predicted  nucleic acid-binding Zn-ribbon protein
MLTSMTTAADLFALQETDLALDADKARLAEIEERLTESQELIDARDVVEEQQQRLDELKSRQSDEEATVEDIRAKADSVDKKLYSGTVTNAKELGDLHADFKMLNNQASQAEDKLLATLVEIDDAEAELTRAQSAFAEVNARWEEEQRRLRAEKAEVEPEISRLESKRNEAASDLDARALSLYNLLRERRGGTAVAKVDRGMCGGCRISLPSAALTKARSSNGLTQCVSCERILLVI